MATVFGKIYYYAVKGVGRKISSGEGNGKPLPRRPTKKKTEK